MADRAKIQTDEGHAQDGEVSYAEAQRRLAEILATHVWRPQDMRCDRCGLGRERIVAGGIRCSHA